MFNTNVNLAVLSYFSELHDVATDQFWLIYDHFFININMIQCYSKLEHKDTLIADLGMDYDLVDVNSWDAVFNDMFDTSYSTSSSSAPQELG